MAEREALRIYLGDGWELLAAGAGRGRDGHLAADILLRRGGVGGEVAYADLVVLNTPQGRAAATAAGAADRPAAPEIERGLLALLEEAQALLQEGAGPRRSQADDLVALASEADLFHTPDDEAFATLPVGDRRETWPLRSKATRRWLAHRYHQVYERAPSAQALQNALTVLEGQALFDGPEHPVYTRLAEHRGTIYLDLANDRWEAIAIGPDGWRVVAEPPVKFRRARGMAPLPHPVLGGSIDEFRAFLNLRDEDQDSWLLVIAWLVGAFRPQGPYPALALHGEQGSAKSTTARLLRALVDPSTVPLRTEPREERDLLIAATNAWVLAFDNLSRLPTWLSDALCRLATGGGFGTRELYSDTDEVLFDAQRPVLLTGIEDLATRSDLLDRTIVCYLPAIPDTRRRLEAAVWREFEAARPRILGALLTAVGAALARLPTVALARLPRLADFARWITAAESALGWPEGAFMGAYTGNREMVNALALESSPVPLAVRALLETCGTWEGTATDLLADLKRHIDEDVVRGREWPKNGKVLANALRRFAPNLRATGVAIEFSREAGGNRRRLIAITQREVAGAAASPASRPSPVPADASTAAVADRSQSPVDAGLAASAAGPVLPSTDDTRWRGHAVTGRTGTRWDGRDASTSTASPAAGSDERGKE